MDILITAAGKSSRFGGIPKYLLEILGYPMLFWALKSFASLREQRVLIAISSEEQRKGVENACVRAGIVAEVFVVGETSGQAETVKKSLSRLRKGPFVIAPTDTFLQNPLTPESLEGNKLLVFPSTDYKSFSFITREDERVKSIVEKDRGELATAGYYGFASKEEFLAGWEKLPHEGEEYVSHVYAELLKLGRIVGYEETEEANVVDLGTPQKLLANLPLVFEKLLSLLPKDKSATLGTIEETLAAHPHPDNLEVLSYLRSYGSRKPDNRVGFGSLVHNYSMDCRTINQLLLEDDLSWLTFFIYDTVDTPYSLWRYLEQYKGAKLHVIKDSPAILYKVPYKRQIILDHFVEEGKEWIVLFDDDFSWRLAYKDEVHSTPVSLSISFGLALRVLSGLAVDKDFHFLCTGTNVRRMQYSNFRPIRTMPGAIYWNIFIMKSEVIKEKGLHFVTDQLIHEDLAMSLDIAKIEDSHYALFLYQIASYDFNNEALVSRESATEAYGKGFWKIKEKLQNGYTTKFFSIDRKAILKSRSHKNIPLF